MPPRLDRGRSTSRAEHYDFAILIQTVEHVADPASLLRAIRRVLRPGGRLLVVTDNTGSLDFSVAKRRHWGGYHFPRHWYLFDAASMRQARRRTPASKSRSSARW